MSIWLDIKITWWRIVRIKGTSESTSITKKFVESSGNDWQQSRTAKSKCEAESNGRWFWQVSKPKGKSNWF